MRIGIDARIYSQIHSSAGMYAKHCIEALEKIDTVNEYFVFLDEAGFLEYEPKAENFTKILAPYEQNSLQEQLVFPFVLYKAKLDIVHFLGNSAPILYKKSFIVSIQDVVFSFYPEKKMLGSFYRFWQKSMISSITEKAKAIIVPSEQTKRDLIEVFGVHDEKIEIIPMGIDANRFKKKSCEKDILQTKELLGIRFEKYIMCSGSFSRHKNFARLLEVFGKISTDFSDVGLVIAGKEDASYHEVRDAIVENKLQEKVRLVGFVNETDYVHLLSGALGYILPSLYEGFGLPALEAMLLGIPVATSSAGALKETLKDGSPFFFSPLNTHEMTTKITALLSDISLQEKSIHDGKNHAEKFSWKYTAEKIVTLYSKE